MDRVLKFLQQELNDYIQFRLGESDKIWLGQLVDEDGKLQSPPNSVIMTMVNLEEEKVMKSQKRTVIEESDGGIFYANPDIKLNMFILFASRFNHYDEALKFLTEVIGFFQARNYFTPDNSPTLPVPIKRIIVDLFSIPLEQLNYMWATLGAKYMPSAIFKLRTLSVQEVLIADHVPALVETKNSVSS